MKALTYLKKIHSDIIDGIESGVNTENEKMEVFECIEELEALNTNKNEHFEYLIRTTTHNIDAGTYASYYAFYLHGYQFAVSEENSFQLKEDIEEYRKIIMDSIR